MKKATRITACHIIFISILFSTSYCFAGNVPSCHDDIAVKQKEPGNSPPCTPAILTNETSIDFLKRFGVKKIKQKWYIFLTEKDFKGEFPVSDKWQTISLLISAVQSLYNDMADCYIVKIPQNDKEKEALLAGNYPQELIAAVGKYQKPEKEVKEDDWPEYHHHFLYLLTVY